MRKKGIAIEPAGGGQPNPPGAASETGPERPDNSLVLNRLERLYAEVDVVKMNAMRKIAQEINQDPGEGNGDTQKENQTVLKSVEIQARLLTDRERLSGGQGTDLALADIWQCLIELPEVGATLHRESVRKRLIETLRRRQEAKP